MAKKWLSLIGLFAVILPVLSQEQVNSAQYHAIHNPNSPYHTGPDQSPASPPVRWATRWGAIAADDHSSVYGIVKGLESKREAQQAAIDECEKRGGRACQVQLAYHNQCAAVIAGTTGSNVSHAETENEAKELGLIGCERVDGVGACRVYYSGCSLPVQIQ